MKLRLAAHKFENQNGSILTELFGVKARTEITIQAQDIIDNPELQEIARLAVEDALVELRDARMSVLFRNNGLTITERDGSSSSIIRLGFEQALVIGLKAILASGV